ncbi:nucleoporin NDC1 [Marchantia polymorpha subsp. ruderalis]|uniref:Uncharacterized protein n=2 Tax=Marchantia polymorpha TaxID=3197 RepID=A0A176VC32_MARPO|nr:hypothetical protein AXG93_2899s1010 [Marchantia polymorpha subsp. ruderalis]PTQ36875.1 hypothetical protein MARPO_0061s0120 [Marchantia polymorpha]BBM99809.1 hypothetical protein Mp_1g24000 [Marchantia polymorpha subsp. ruderalis]|eukprot:PTQ36875.1 hypothetical protein MARPO_0061s0120 [Marchantia polymorpha]
MVTAVSSLVWRDVVGKRWARCAVWLAVTTSVVWVIWETTISRLVSHSSSQGSSETKQYFMPSMWALIRFLVFQASQLLFLVGQTFVSEPEEANAASLAYLVGKFLKLAWRAGVGRTRGDDFFSDVAELRQKLRATLDHASYVTMCVLSGAMAFSSLMSSIHMSSGRLNPLNIGVRGAALGLLYAGWQFYHSNVTLRFPIIQRRLFFAFKMRIPEALNFSLHMALILLPLGETFARIVPDAAPVPAQSTSDRQVVSFLWRQLLFAAVSFCVTFSWESCHQLIQVIQTKRHILAPPLGSAAAETDPTDLLLMVLEESDTGSLVQYHAYLDLCVVSESNVDTWRRAAFFEESGDTYKRLISACLKKLDGLTLRLAQGLEVGESEKGADLLKQQMQSSPGDNRHYAFQLGNVKAYFQDSQVCSWCARTVASLTASSRYEDRYGVAQLHGCNTAVVSSLLSCLLVIEVYLGRRSTARGAIFVPNSIKWTVPSRGTFMEVGKKQGYPFGKRTVMHKKAYAMADVLRTSLYQIVSVFGDEMVLVGPSGKGNTIAERDWLNRKKPLYGTHEMHLQKLSMFLEYRIG